MSNDGDKGGGGGGGGGGPDLVQYIVVHRVKGYGVGALIAQGAHASSAALHLSRDQPDTAAYLAALDSMHKVVLEGPSAEALRETAAALDAAGVVHKLWVEQPEGIVTALASAPRARAVLKPLFAAFKLLR